MKTLLFIASSLLVLSSTFARTITVDIPQGHKIVVISSSVWHSGCGSTTIFHGVVKTEDGFAIGTDVGLKNDDPITRNLMPKLRPIIDEPKYTCMAYVQTTNKARFVHQGTQAETVTVDVPSFMDRNLKVTFEDIQVVY